ncbi:peptide deformylase [[Eubacterium] yurii subsp. margaretiae ATCC 43715]|nr:peptide deformylase [[Eubacterium] yurii subsp. margaretiae ATCC 43715]
MGIRNLRIDGDPLLRKVSREVTELSDKIRLLIEDMMDTMTENDGVGLAAPQVGVLKRVIVVDVSDVDPEVLKDENAPDEPIALINPVIIEKDGEEVGQEGCLSVPNLTGDVKRPSRIVVKAKNEKFEDVVFEAKHFFARVLCHEIDHLNGVLYIDKAENLRERVES